MVLERVTEKLIGYAILGIGGLLIIWYVFTHLGQILGGIFTPGQSEAIKETSVTLTYLIKEYENEAKEFLENDGVIDASEQGVLDTKKSWIKDLIDMLGKAMADPTKIAVAITAVIALFVMLYKGGPRVINYLKNWGSNLGKADPNTGNEYTYSFNTAIELAMFGRIAAILSIADAGNITLASNALTAEINNYFNNVLPQMQSQYNLLLAQIPNLTGVQLALAQIQIMQFSYYLQFYSTPTLPPPLFTLMPPLI